MFSGLQNSAEPGKSSFSLVDVNLQSYGPKLQTFHGEYGTYVNSSDVRPVETKWFHDTGGDQVSQQFVWMWSSHLNTADIFQISISDVSS